MAGEKGRGTAAGKKTSGARRGAAKGAADAAPTNGSGALERMIDLEFLRELIAAVDESGIDSLELKRAGTRIRIAKTPPPAPAAAPGHAVAMVQPHGHAPGPHLAAPAAGHGAPSTSGAAAPAATEDAAPASNLVDIKSPMVGTFYRSPAPEAPSYVEVGSSVAKGQTLCILEAMKLMNELESEVEGVIREILVDNADPVEFGQVLFRVEPAGGKA